MRDGARRIDTVKVVRRIDFEKTHMSEALITVYPRFRELHSFIEPCSSDSMPTLLNFLGETDKTVHDVDFSSLLLKGNF
jgi:hypothetical protein